MALVLLDRVRETTFSIGTGAITFSGAVAGYQPFSAIGDGNTTYYTIYDTTANDWEVGIGTYALSTNELSRTTVLSSSTGGTLVSFAAGSKEVFVTYPAEKAIYEQVNGETIINAGPITVIGAGVTSVPTLPAELGKFVGNVNSFAQIYNLNQNDGDTASADFVAYNNLTDDGYNNFTDMGINSSNYTSVDYPIFTPGSGYVFHDGDDFFIGNQTPNKDVVLFAGGADITDEAVRISGTDRSVTLDTDLNVGGALDVTGATDITGPATFGSTVTLNDNPTTPLEAATKQYVDNQVTAGLHIHEPVFAESGINLIATYVQGGTTFNITDITSTTTVTTSVNHGLSVNDQIWLYNTAGNGLSINTAYFVFSTPAANQLTLSLTFGGAQITGLTNASGLTYNTRANSGVGATLTNAGTKAALVVDSAPLNVSNRVMVRLQTNGEENGVYVVTTVGTPDPGGTNWVLTRAADSNQVNPADPNGVGTGDYYFTRFGNINAGNSNVLTTQPNTMIIGYTPLTYTEFSGGVSFVGGTNIDVTGQVISLTGVVAPSNGGTGVSTVSLGDLLYGEASGGWGNLPVGAPYNSLIVNSAGTQIEWNAVPLNESGAVSGALPPTNGGTGINAYATGDIIYSDATNSLAALPGNTTTTKKFLNQTGTGSASQAPSWDTVANTDVTGLGTMSTQDADTVAITGGSIDNTTVGATTPTTGAFTSLSLTGSVSGTTTFEAASTTTSTTYVLPDTDGSPGYLLRTNGAGILSWDTGIPATALDRGVVYGITTDGPSYNVGLGYDVFAAGSNNVVVGVNASSTATDAVVVGSTAASTANSSVVIGSESSSAGTSSIVVGFSSSAAVTGTTVIGSGLSPASAGVYVSNVINGTGSVSGYGTLKYNSTTKEVVYDTNAGNVVGPASATDTAVAIYDGTTGKLLKNSDVTIGSTGNLNITATGARITGDFSNATHANRVAFQSSTTNGATSVGVIPNGTGNYGGLSGYNASDPANASIGTIAAAATEVQVVSTRTGTGTFLPLTFYTAAGEAMRIDTSRNVGIGVTPSAWRSGERAIDIAGGAAIAGVANEARIYANAFVDGTPDFKYKATAAASFYNQSGGSHLWYNAPSGTAGNAITFTQAMTLDTSSRLGVGPDASSPRQRITLGNTTSVATATPESIDMGGTFSNTAGSNLKLRLWNDGGTVFGVGVSASQMDYVVPTGSTHAWYVGGTVRARIAGDGFMFNAANGNTAQGLVPGMLTYILNADLNLNGTLTTAQNVFGVATATLQPGRYRFRTVIGLIKNTGTGTIGFSLGGTATFAYLFANATSRLGAAFTTVVAVNSVTITSTTPTTNTVISVGTVAVSNNTITAEGFFDVSVAGNATFGITFSAAPGTATAGSYRSSRGSFVEVWPASATGANTNIGGWA